MEEWRTVPGTDGYLEVSNEGRVRSLLRGKPNILKATEDTNGYLRLRMTIHRKRYSFKVHRLVAQAFIDNPNNLPQVNHIDGDKKNNRVNNLEWVTNQENVIHSFALANGEKCSVHDIKYVPKRIYLNGKRIYLDRKGDPTFKKPNERKPIIAYRNGERMAFGSVGDAERYFDSRHITDVLKGKRQHVKGWTFEYQEGEKCLP